MDFRDRGIHCSFDPYIATTGNVRVRVESKRNLVKSK